MAAKRNSFKAGREHEIKRNENNKRNRSNGVRRITTNKHVCGSV